MCVFEVREPNGWAESVAAFQQLRGDDGRTVTLKGVCLACGHTMSVELWVEERVGQRVTEAQNEEPLAKGFLKVASCNCLDPHDKRPAGETGCGAFGALMIGAASDDPQ